MNNDNNPETTARTNVQIHTTSTLNGPDPIVRDYTLKVRDEINSVFKRSVENWVQAFCEKNFTAIQPATFFLQVEMQHILHHLEEIAGLDKDYPRQRFFEISLMLIREFRKNLNQIEDKVMKSYAKQNVS